MTFLVSQKIFNTNPCILLSHRLNEHFKTNYEQNINITKWNNFKYSKFYFYISIWQNITNEIIQLDSIIS